MSSRSRFLLPKDEILELAKKHLLPPSTVPDGQEEAAETLHLSAFTLALESAIIAFFTEDAASASAWARSRPIALGSWARGELTPKSDLDLLFIGDEAAAAEVTRRAQEAGIKIRSRTPEDRDDWMKGVEAFDVLALLLAKPLTEDAATHFAVGISKVKAKLKKVRRGFFKTLKDERKQRGERYDSIANFLEPNLKYGPGGLRDLGQALQLRQLFPERFLSSEREHALHVYDYYRRLFLLTRIRSQVSDGGGDLLSAHEQADIATWFGFTSSREFMREIQKGLSRVSFYADVDFEHVKISEVKLQRFHSKEMEFVELAAWLEKEPTVLVQAKARDTGFRLYRSAVRKSELEKTRANEALGRLLSRAVDPLQDDKVTLALFRSRWIDLAVTDFKKIVGYVQHDQYHRYTVDAHLMQAVREMKRVAQKPGTLGRLSGIAKALSRDEWKILGWTALYHDVGKGTGGDHSDKSVMIARNDLEKWGLSQEMILEVIWLIENHLELSLAAFRGNPAHPTTWRRLHAKGIEGKRLLRLAIFTCVDIRATNREAYTPWKERLLAELVEFLERPEAKMLSSLERKLDESKAGRELLPLLDRLDPFLVATIPVKTLAEDIVTVGREPNISVRVLKLSKEGRVWVRFQTSVDRAGLFVKMARTLQAAGLSVRHASILSADQVGVYDWFEVKPPNSLKGLEAKLLRIWNADGPRERDRSCEGAELKIFDEIECSASPTEWVLSFRGRDTKGALLAAAEAIADEGLSVLWAKVHTWGRQIDDVFGVEPVAAMSTDEIVQRLKLRVGAKE